MDSFTIKDIENLSGIKAHTLRIWEQRYSIFKPHRSDTNIRYFSNAELKKILNVALLNKYGLKISHIDKMNEVEIHEKILSLNHSEAIQDRMVNQMIHCMTELNLTQFEKIIDQFIDARGLEKALTQVIFPFLEKIGLLWSTSHINPAQEHLVTNLIRQKIIVGIETMDRLVTLKSSFLLFLPESEHHEIGLLVVYYLLRQKGAEVSYLGANIPVKDLIYTIEIKKPDYLYCHLSSFQVNMDKFIGKLSASAKNTDLYISGRLAQEYNKPLPDGMYAIQSMEKLKEFISTLE